MRWAGWLAVCMCMCVCARTRMVLGRPSHKALVGKEIWFRGAQGEVSVLLGSLVCQLRGGWRSLSCQGGAGEPPQGLSYLR